MIYLDWAQIVNCLTSILLSEINIPMYIHLKWLYNIFHKDKYLWNKIFTKFPGLLHIYNLCLWRYKKVFHTIRPFALQKSSKQNLTHSLSKTETLNNLVLGVNIVLSWYSSYQWPISCLLVIIRYPFQCALKLFMEVFHILFRCTWCWCINLDYSDA